MRRVTDKEITAVTGLDGPRRFKHFIKSVADAEEAWGLWDDGWALFEDNAGVRVFPLWPAREYAEICRDPDWSNYKATAIPLNDLLDDLLPKLGAQGLLAGIFPTPSGKGVTPQLGELEDALRQELENY